MSLCVDTQGREGEGGYRFPQSSGGGLINALQGASEETPSMGSGTRRSKRIL